MKLKKEMPLDTEFILNAMLPKISQELKKARAKKKKMSRQEREWVVWNDEVVCKEVASFSLSHTLQQPKYASQHENHTVL